jgi:hypothetical protein
MIIAAPHKAIIRYLPPSHLSDESFFAFAESQPSPGAIVMAGLGDRDLAVAIGERIDGAASVILAATQPTEYDVSSH